MTIGRGPRSCMSCIPCIACASLVDHGLVGFRKRWVNIVTELNTNSKSEKARGVSRVTVQRKKAQRSRRRKRSARDNDIQLVYRDSRGRSTLVEFKIAQVDDAIDVLQEVKKRAGSTATSELSSTVTEAEAGAQRILDELNRHRHTSLLTASGMADYAHRGRNWAAENTRQGRLIAVSHAGRTFYPAFQIDPDKREVRGWVPKMIQILEELGLDGRDFTIWAAIKSDRFRGDAPVEHMGDEDFLTKAAAALTPA